MMRRAARASLIVAIFLMLGLAGIAKAALITFAESTPPDMLYGPTYLTPQNFLFSTLDANGHPTPVRIWDTSVFYPTSTSEKAIVNSQLNGTNLMTQNDGVPFSVASLDIANLYARTVTFTGNRADGTRVTLDVDVPGNSYQYITVSFSGFDNLTRLRWDEQSNSVTNISVSSVPEPLTGMVTFGWLTALALLRRRRSSLY